MTSSSARLRAVLMTALALGILSGGSAAWAKPKKRPHPWKFSLRGEGQAKYDSNIIMLSSNQKNQLKKSSLRNSDRFKIDTRDDIILAP